MRSNHRLFTVFMLCILFTACNKNQEPDFQPNILWITCEDISPFLGCYGDSLGTTPVLDQLAAEGIRFTNFYANAPVCAPARFTILHGVHASSAGTMNMRSRYQVPAHWKPYPIWLREAGYYCTNNSKTDYNFDGDWAVWDESSNEAHYKNRDSGQPFFAIFNLTLTHESRIHNYDPADLIHNPDDMVIPPYVPDRQAIREDMAKLYDNITRMDTRVGELIDELDSFGLRDSTLVFYYSDHGGVYPRAKRFIHRSGTQVPMIVSVPEELEAWWPGGLVAWEEQKTKGKGQKAVVSERLVSFVDLAPTLLSIAGIEAPDYMEGKAFMGQYIQDPHEEIYLFRNRMDERIDCMRAITDGRYRYQYNFMPHRPYGQHVGYLWRAAGMQEWEQAWLNGELNEVQSTFWTAKPLEELYDLAADPWEINNLVEIPEHTERLNSMRAQMMTRMLEHRDAGFIPEGMLVNINLQQPAHDFAQSTDYPLGDLVEFMNAQQGGRTESLAYIIEGLHHESAIMRYWAAMSTLQIDHAGDELLAALTNLLSDESPEVSLVAGEALYRFGKHDLGMKAIRAGLHHDNPKVVLLAFNILEYFDEADKNNLLPDIKAVGERLDSEYVNRMVEHYL